VKKNPILCHSGKGGNKIENKKYRYPSMKPKNAPPKKGGSREEERNG